MYAYVCIIIHTTFDCLFALLPPCPSPLLTVPCTFQQIMPTLSLLQLIIQVD